MAVYSNMRGESKMYVMTDTYVHIQVNVSITTAHLDTTTVHHKANQDNTYHTW